MIDAKVMLDCKAQSVTLPTRTSAGRGAVCRRVRPWLGALLVFAAVSPVCAEVAIYQDVFEGQMQGWDYSPDYSVWERRFECHAYGPWGTPSLVIGIDCEVSASGDTETVTLAARELEPPVVELGPSFDPSTEPLLANYDIRGAWFIAPKKTNVSVSNTIYRASVFKNEGTGRDIPEKPYTYTCARYETKELYLYYGHPNGTTVGWVKINIWDGQASVMDSCIAIMSALRSNPAKVASATVHMSSAAAERIMIRMSVRFISTSALMQEPYTIPIKDMLTA